MENNRNESGWKIIAICAMAMMTVVSCLYASVINKKEPAPVPETEPAPEANWLSLWNDDARAKKELMEFMAAITEEGGPDYIPVENRVAVFDLDGTLFCETDPVYFDHMLFMHRVKEDPNYKATEFDLEVAEKVQEFIDTGSYPEGLDNLHGQGVAESFAGMTIKEFYDYVKEFGKTPSPGYNNMNRGDAFYLPMVEIIEYLQENQFKTYIVSGTDRLILRGALSGLDFMHIPANQIIGSDELLVSPKQGDADGLDYVFTSDDELVLAGKFIIKNLKMNKVTVIAQEIGMQPVLSFGNSSGDYSMATYTISNNPYRSLAFMLCCDDTVRENGNEEKAQKMVEACEKNGWIPISMKNDWSTIYGAEVTRK
ncbi:MAG: haloacid dehalogenase-like hydrolase [Erysipelotrichaceae bacterium]|nr:haloacid dehalogenase-like hydrolase [Erysipelotrichaceae bacterium]